jgi:hypothetical protein
MIPARYWTAKMILNRSLSLSFVALTLLLFATPRLILGQQSAAIDLAPANSTTTIYRIISRLDGRGSVSTDEDTTLDLRLDARFNYDERVIARKQSLKSVRDYQTARAEIRLGPGSVINQLDASHTILIVQTTPASIPVKFASAGGPLTQKELELINTPANTLTISELLSKSNVKVGESWSPNKDRLANFLNIDLVGQSNVELTLEKVEKGIAQLFIGGDVTGMIDDAGTEINISGTIHFDINEGFARGYDITLNQQRDMGRLAPGLNATFKIATRIAPISDNDQLTDEGLAQLREQTNRITDLLAFVPPNKPIQLLHSRQWRVISEHPNRSILRLIENGEMLGQCDIIPLPVRAAEQSQTIEQFREVVEANLAEHNATITGVNQSATKSGLEWMKVSALGSSNGVKLVWDYYTITHSDGRRIQLVFTTEPQIASRFSSQYDTLISNISFEKSTAAQNAGYQK